MTGAAVAAAAALAACGGGLTPTPAASSAPVPNGSAKAPALQHLVIVVEENHSYSQIAGNGAAPYMNRLMRTGANLTHMFAIAHPSEPNYVALFSGSTHGLTGDDCPVSYRGRNLATQLRSASLTFAGFSDGLPSTGYEGCSYGEYARKHVPWTDFPNVPRRLNRPFSALPRTYAALPTVSFVIPDLEHDMHDGTVAQADTWLRMHLGGYVRWARTHDSALLLTWDENDGSRTNRIATVVVGAHVRTMRYRRNVDTYSLLRTVEWLYGLPPLGRARYRSPITAIWR